MTTQNNILAIPAQPRFSSRRVPCPHCGARHGYAAYIGTDGGYCHACRRHDAPPRGEQITDDRRERRRERRQTPPPPRPRLIDSTPWEHYRTYDYFDEAGAILYHVDRLHRMAIYEGGEWEREKDVKPRPAGMPMRQTRSGELTGASIEGVRRVLYDLPSVLSAIRQGGSIWIVEGERAADWLTDHLRHEIGSLDRATTAMGGANGWSRADRAAGYAESLRGADVILWPDDDAAGRVWLADVQRALTGAARRVRVLSPEKARAISQEVGYGA